MLLLIWQLSTKNSDGGYAVSKEASSIVVAGTRKEEVPAVKADVLKGV